MRSIDSLARRIAVALTAVALTAGPTVMIGSQTAAAATPTALNAPQVQDDPPMVDNNFAVTVEGAYGDKRFTVFRPSDPQSVGHPLPVLAFGNGACAHVSISEVTPLLKLVASKGIVVVDTGSVDGSDNGVPSGSPIPSLLTDAITWAGQEQDRTGSPLSQQLDLTKVATAGHSCGGLEALIAAQDDRVSGVVSFDSGLFADGSFGYPRSELYKLHTPVMFMDGGSSDIAYENSGANYDMVTVPAVRATHPYAGHVGFITGDQMTDGVTTAVSFLDMVLNGNEQARSYILDSSGLASHAPWQTANKNF